METQRFQQRSVSELLDASVRLTKAHYKPLLALSAIAYIPVILVGLVAPQPIPGEELTPEQTEQLFRSVLYLIIPLLWYVIAWTAMIVFAAGAYTGRETTAGAALRQVLRRTPTLLGATFLKWLVILAIGVVLILISSMLLGAVTVAAGGTAAVTIIMGVLIAVVTLAIVFILTARFFFVGTAVALESAGARQSVKRSAALTRGETWRVVKAIVLFYVLIIAVWLTLYAVGGIFTDNPIINNAMGQLSFIFTFQLIPTVTALLYYDLRIRKEGYDLELMAQSLGTPAATSSQPQVS